jgi:hypothetical protein
MRRRSVSTSSPSKANIGRNPAASASSSVSKFVANPPSDELLTHIERPLLDLDASFD